MTHPVLRQSPGFTLLEVMVALVIAGLALAALVQGAGVGLGGTRIATQYGRALALARSRLAATEATPAAQLQSGAEQSGTEPGGFSWRTTTTLAEQSPPTPANPRRLGLYVTAVTVSWSAGATPRTITLTARRLATAAPPPP